MSYILDAIKKAENQRRHDQVPSLEAMVTERAKQASNRRIPWKSMLLAFLILALGVVSWLYQDPIMDKLKQGYVFTQHKIASLTQTAQSYFQEKEAPSTTAKVETPQESNVTVKQAPKANSEAKTSQADQSGQTDQTDQGNSTTRLPRPPDRLIFSVVSYAKDPNKRFVMAGEYFVREGETHKQYLISEITENGVIVEKSGQRFFVRP